MTLLFSRDYFDAYALEEGEITTYAAFNIDGRFRPEFFKNEDSGGTADGASLEFVPWGKIRETCASLIKGKNTPLSIRLVLWQDPSKYPDIPNRENVRSLLIMIRFDGSSLSVTSGLNKIDFSLDRSAESFWDAEIPKILLKAGVDFEEA